MTIIDTATTAPTQQRETGWVGALIAQLLSRFGDYREMRRAKQPRAFYHNHRRENLERARRDVNRLWQHHF